MVGNNNVRINIVQLEKLIWNTVMTLKFSLQKQIKKVHGALKHYIWIPGLFFILEGFEGKNISLPGRSKICTLIRDNITSNLILSLSLIQLKYEAGTNQDSSLRSRAKIFRNLDLYIVLPLFTYLRKSLVIKYNIIFSLGP